MAKLYDANLGWNAGGQSKNAFAGDCVAAFAVPATASGVVVGLAGLTVNDFDYRALPHALYFTKGHVSVVEAGVSKTAPVTFTDSDAFSLQRVAGSVRYLMNSTVLYVSATPSQGTVVLRASLYAAGDQVT
jgi:hypothetical protein